MEKLPMCRICLAQNVHMHIVANRNLHELYEKLTDIPFVTEDNRPILACLFCYAKLKQCHQFLIRCREAEGLFTLMMNEDYESSPLMDQYHLEDVSGFIKSPIVHISIGDECQTKSIAIKEELPAVCDDIIEPKEEHQTEGLDPESLDNSCLDVADIPTQQSESDEEDDIIELNIVGTEVGEEQEVATETIRVPVAKKTKKDTRRTKLEDAIIAEHTETDKSDSKLIRTIQKRPSKPGTYFKEPYKRHLRCLHQVKKIIKHTRTQVGEKPYKCDVCERSFNRMSSLSTHSRVHTRSFRQKGVLSTDIRQHTGENLFKCGVCQRSFNRKGSLSAHIRIHTLVKNFLSVMFVNVVLIVGVLYQVIANTLVENPMIAI